MFQSDAQTYLITVDYYSEFIEVDEVKDLRCSTTLEQLTAQFRRHGLPETLRNDNVTAQLTTCEEILKRSWNHSSNVSPQISTFKWRGTEGWTNGKTTLAKIYREAPGLAGLYIAQHHWKAFIDHRLNY